MRAGRSRVGGIERVRGRGSYGIALTFDLIPLPASLETPCRPLPSVPRARTLLRDRLECEALATDESRRGPRKIQRVKERNEFFNATGFSRILVASVSVCLFTRIDMPSVFRE